MAGILLQQAQQHQLQVFGRHAASARPATAVAAEIVVGIAAATARAARHPAAAAGMARVPAAHVGVTFMVAVMALVFMMTVMALMAVAMGVLVPVTAERADGTVVSFGVAAVAVEHGMVAAVAAVPAVGVAAHLARGARQRKSVWRMGPLLVSL